MTTYFDTGLVYIPYPDTLLFKHEQKAVKKILAIWEYILTRHNPVVARHTTF